MAFSHPRSRIRQSASPHQRLHIPETGANAEPLSTQLETKLSLAFPLLGGPSFHFLISLNFYFYSFILGITTVFFLLLLF